MKKGSQIRTSMLKGLLCALGLLLGVSIPSAMTGTSQGHLTLTEFARNAGNHVPTSIALINLLGSEPVILALFGGGLVLIALLLRNRVERRRMIQSESAKLETQTTSSS